MGLNFVNTHLLNPYNPAFWGNSEIGPSKGFGRVLKISKSFPLFLSPVPHKAPPITKITISEADSETIRMDYISNSIKKLKSM
jgi:hypothetical protein